MTSEQFSRAILDALASPTDSNHAQFSALHTRLYSAYRTAIGRLSAEEVMAPLTGPGDPRTLAQVIGHIAAWDRFSIQAAGDILGGVTHPRAVTSVKGFIDQEGQPHNFTGVDDFNVFFARQQAHMAWLPLQLEAIGAARTLHALFTQPDLLTGQRLAQTKPWRKRLPNGAVVESTMGWVLWVIVLEHYVGEHAAELGMELI